MGVTLFFHRIDERIEFSWTNLINYDFKLKKKRNIQDLVSGLFNIHKCLGF